MSNPVQNLDASLAAVVDKLGQLAEKHGGDAIAIAAKATALSLVPSMLGFLGFLLVAIAFFFLGRIAIRCYEEDKLSDYDIAGGIAYAVSGVCVVAMIIYLIQFTINPLYWAALADPRIALAAKALGLL